MRTRDFGNWIGLADHEEIFYFTDEIFGVSFDSISENTGYQWNMAFRSNAILYLTTRKSVE